MADPVNEDKVKDEMMKRAIAMSLALEEQSEIEDKDEMLEDA